MRAREHSLKDVYLGVLCALIVCMGCNRADSEPNRSGTEFQSGGRQPHPQLERFGAADARLVARGQHVRGSRLGDRRAVKFALPLLSRL